MALSASLEISAFLDFFDILGISDIMPFEEIIVNDAGGVGLGVKPVATSNSALTLKSPTPST